MLLNVFDTLITWSVFVVMTLSCSSKPLVVEKVFTSCNTRTEPSMVLSPTIDAIRKEKHATITGLEKYHLKLKIEPDQCKPEKGDRRRQMQ